MKDFSYITNSHPEFIENMYRDYSRDPDSIDPEMKKFFEGFDFAIKNASANGNDSSVSAQRKTESAPVTKNAEVDSKTFDWMRV